MEVQFTAEQQAKLAQLAPKAGTDPERLVTTVVGRYLDEEARFLAAMEKAAGQDIAAAQANFPTEPRPHPRFGSCRDENPFSNLPELISAYVRYRTDACRETVR